MKLKLHTQNTLSLKNTLSLIAPIRKFVILRFSRVELSVILVNGVSITLEPQVWCRLQLANLFDEIEIQSLRDDTILIEINVDLLLQTLRNFDRAHSYGGLSIKLQKKDLSGQQGVSVGNGRTASLALLYSNTNLNSNTIDHMFRIPVKILKNTHEAMVLREPRLSNVELMVLLPTEFASIYKRLDKYKRNQSSLEAANELLTIRVSRRNGGFLGFVLEEEGKYNVTISWNRKMQIRRPAGGYNVSIHSVVDDFYRAAAGNGAAETNETSRNDNENEGDKSITVPFRDWRMASKIVANCKSVVLLISESDSCALHCVLDESETEIVYYIHGARMVEE